MVCLIMSLPSFSQRDTETDLICIPTSQARQIATELTEYDFCQQERDSLKAEIVDLNNIVSQDSILLIKYQNVTDSLFLSNETYLNSNALLKLDLKNKDEKIKSLRSTKTITILTTVIGTLTPILLSNNN
jgi:hypothetical protein